MDIDIILEAGLVVCKLKPLALDLGRKIGRLGGTSYDVY